MYLGQCDSVCYCNIEQYVGDESLLAAKARGYLFIPGPHHDLHRDRVIKLHEGAPPLSGEGRGHAGVRGHPQHGDK